MDRQPGSPRYVLILGGLFLIAYMTYQVGLAWMGAHPPATPTLVVSQPYPKPESSIDPVEPIEPYPGVEMTGTPVPPTPARIVTNTPDQAYPVPEMTNTPAQPTPVTTNTPVQPYPEPEISHTPDSTFPTSAPTNTEAAPADPAPTATPPAVDTPTLTLTNLPSATPPGDAYPGPEETLRPTPTNTATSPDSNDPYPGPEATNTPQPTTAPTEVDGESSPTPTVTATSQPTIPTLTPTRELLPTLESTPTPNTTLVFTETLILSDGSVNQVIWLEDESNLALATSNGIYLYQLMDGESLILDAGSPIASVVEIPDEEWIAAGGLDSLIRIWDISDGKFVNYMSGHLLGVVRLSYAPIGGFLVSASDDATVWIWDLDGNPRYTLRGPITRVMDIDVSSNEQMVAAASNQNVHIWNPQTGELLHTISKTSGWYSAAAFSPDNQTLTTAFEGRRLELWDTNTWERVDLFALQTSVRSLVYSTNGRMLAIGYLDGRIEIRDSYYQYILANLNGHPEITSMAFNFYGDQLVTSSANGTIRFWDLTPLLTPE